MKWFIFLILILISQVSQAKGRPIFDTIGLCSRFIDMQKETIFFDQSANNKNIGFATINGIFYNTEISCINACGIKIVDIPELNKQFRLIATGVDFEFEDYKCVGIESF